MDVDYKRTRIPGKVIDNIIGYLEQPGVDSSQQGVVIFTGVGEPKIPRFSGATQPTAINVEARLLEMFSSRGNSFPLEGKYWSCADKFLAGNPPDYVGKIDVDKAGKLGLLGKETQPIKIFSDGLCYLSKVSQEVEKRNDYEGTNVSKTIEDVIIRHLERPEVDSSETRLVLFTDFSGTKLDLKDWLMHMDNNGEGAPPFDGVYWYSADDFLGGNPPNYVGRIGADKARELGLFNPRIHVIKVYSGCVYFPEK